MSRWSTEDFQDSETTLCNTVKLDACHYVFFQVHRMYIKSEFY